MKRWFVITVLLLALSSPVVQAGSGWNTSLSVNIVDNMWQLMEWFVGRNEGGRYAPYRPWQEGGAGLPRYSAPYAMTPDWSELGALEGVWLAQSGEYWVVRRGQFVLYQPLGGVVRGEYRREGYFLRLFGPWGELQFEFRQMGDVMMMQDTSGQLSILRRVQSAHWAW